MIVITFGVITVISQFEAVMLEWIILMSVDSSGLVDNKFTKNPSN